MKKYIVIIVILLGLMGCGRTDHHENHEDAQDREHELEADEHHDHLHIDAETIRQKGIGFASPVRRDFSEYITLTGVVRQNQQSTFRVNALAAGTVHRVLKDIGERVKKGEALCVLNSPGFLELKTRYLKSFQEFLLCQGNHERARRLYEIKGIELKELLKREAACKTAMAEYFSLEAELTGKGMSRERLKGVKKAFSADASERVRDFLSPFYTVTAPISGKVVHRDLVPGEWVENRRTLFEISDTRRVWVLLDALEKDLEFIEKQKKVAVATDVYPAEVFAGKIVNIMEKLDPELRTVKLRVEVENPQDRLKPEMYVKGSLKQKTRGKFLAVPTRSMVKVSSVNGVFAKEGDGFVFVPLEILGTDPGGFVFVKGLKGDETVVTDGAFYLKAEYEISRGTGADPHAGHNH